MSYKDGIDIARQPVTSSNIKAIGFALMQSVIAPATGVLEVEFMNGGIYRYHDVPQETARQLMEQSGHRAGPTVGQLFDAKIRKGGYKFEKLADAPPRETTLGELGLPPTLAGKL